jgi:hypothetical protein
MAEPIVTATTNAGDKTASAAETTTDAVVDSATRSIGFLSNMSATLLSIDTIMDDQSSGMQKGLATLTMLAQLWKAFSFKDTVEKLDQVKTAVVSVLTTDNTGVQLDNVRKSTAIDTIPPVPPVNVPTGKQFERGTGADISGALGNDVGGGGSNVDKLVEPAMKAAEEAQFKWMDTANLVAFAFSQTAKGQEESWDNILMLMMSAFKAMSSTGGEGGGTGIGGMVGGAIGGWFGGPAGSAAGSKIGGAIGAAFGFANGGIMTPNGSLPLNMYSSGGIAKGPQLAMFGEGRMNEAYVPLPDGKTIPVTMSGGGTTENNIQISIAMDSSGTASTSANAGGSEEYGKKLGVAISNAVKQELANQQRPGGLLYKGGRR